MIFTLENAVKSKGSFFTIGPEKILLILPKDDWVALAYYG